MAYHLSEDGQEDGDGAGVCGDLGEGGCDEAEDKHDEVGRKTPKYTQHLPNECRQARLLQQQQERHINNY